MVSKSCRALNLDRLVFSYAALVGVTAYQGIFERILLSLTLRRVSKPSGVIGLPGPDVFYLFVSLALIGVKAC